MSNKTLESQNQFINALKNPETQASAFTKLLADYKERLYWHIRKIVIEHDDADDVLQNTFVKVFQILMVLKETVAFTLGCIRSQQMKHST